MVDGGTLSAQDSNFINDIPDGAGSESSLSLFGGGSASLTRCSGQLTNLQVSEGSMFSLDAASTTILGLPSGRHAGAWGHPKLDVDQCRPR